MVGALGKRPWKWTRLPTGRVGEPGSALFGLRFASGGRILVLLTASAVGSGPGCQPFGWGAGFCALRPQVDDTLYDVLDERHPSVTGTKGLTPFLRVVEHFMLPTVTPAPVILCANAGRGRNGMDRRHHLPYHLPRKVRPAYEG